MDPALVRRRRAARAARPLKIVVTGPFAAGKTSLIQAISEVTVLGTERAISDDTDARKDTTTVAMDFGRVSLSNGLALFLFGTPGQRRFEVMWEVLSEGMIGFVLLVNGSDERSAADAARQLETFQAYADVPFVVGVTHLDAADGDEAAALERIRARLGLDEEADVVACDPRAREDVKAMMLRILFGVLRRLETTDRLDDPPAERVAAAP
ncbi:MAG: ATP/GTP-binding protein [Actinomycetota bacterium]|nr:ATP/GTP-binding protein [Actinomycetota bacterium]